MKLFLSPIIKYNKRQLRFLMSDTPSAAAVPDSSGCRIAEYVSACGSALPDTKQDTAPLPQAPEESGIILEEENLPSASDPMDISFGEVRFLMAASAPHPLTVSIDGMIYGNNASFGTIGEYFPISDGFHQISIYYTSGPRILLLEKVLPFRGGEQATVVIADSEASGIDLIPVSDTACRNPSSGYGCLRTANMSFSGSVFDLLLKTGEPVFRDIPYTAVAPYKQAEEGDWSFQVSSLTCSDTYREIPAISLKSSFSSCLWIAPVLDFQVSIKAGKSYTAYLIGDPWAGRPLQALITEDGSRSLLQELSSRIPL